MANIKSFNRQLERLALEFPAQETKKIVRSIALQGLKRIVEKTPVDTGRAQNSWQTTAGIPPETDLPEGSWIGRNSISEGIAAIRAEFDPFAEAVNISSNVEYIIYLEEGSSKQAPSGMVSTTLTELERISLR